MPGPMHQKYGGCGEVGLQFQLQQDALGCVEQLVAGVFGVVLTWFQGMRARIRVRLAAFVRINQEASNEPKSARVRPWQVHFQDFEHTLGFTLPEGP